MSDTLFERQETLPSKEEYVVKVKEKFSKAEGELDTAALLDAKAESDRFIDQLKEETKSLRNELSSRQSVEEALGKLVQGNTNRSTSNNNQPPVEERLLNEMNSQKPNESSLSKEDVMSMVRDALVSESSKAKKLSNLQHARSELEKNLGPNYVSHLTKKAEELGVPTEFFDKLASESPKALIALVNQSSSNKDVLSTPPSSNGMNSSINGSGNKKTYKYYEDLRKKDSKTYWSPSVQNEMFKTLQAMGPDFYK